jgi:5-methyltetrahydropteroyltriglutamate--homocysteine methyltransferase
MKIARRSSRARSRSADTVSDRILTTHVGSLVRPPELLAVLERNAQEPMPAAELNSILQRAVAEVVLQQAEHGIDIVSDGEFGKSHSWSQYIIERLSGFERRPLAPGASFTTIRGKDYRAFKDFYDEYEQAHGPAGLGKSISPATLVVTGPLSYRGEAVAADIARLQRATKEASVTGAFLPVVAPASVAPNRKDEHYRSDEDFLFALADELNKEYRAIIEAGLFLQVDDAYLATHYDVIGDYATYRKWAELRVTALNRALRGIPPERSRYHLCWGSWNGPHSNDIELARIADLLLRIDVGGYSIEMANPRHEHEWRVWQDVKLPAGKILYPGVVSHCTNVVEHPELVAERIVRLAGLVGRENVVASTDCGFAQGPFGRRVHPSIMWAKLRSLAEGAQMATHRLWGRGSTSQRSPIRH